MTRLRWHTEATDYPNKKHGKARIFKYRCRVGHTYWAEGMKGLMYYGFVPGHNRITELTINSQCWMTDLPQYYWSLEYFAKQSRGQVLVAGLGLGLVVHCLVKNPEVKNIAVIEREPDVINLIKPLLPDDPRINIIEADFHRFMPWDKERRDTVIFDLGLWSMMEGEEHVERHGYIETFLIKDQVESQYGKDCRCFRHGLDRDPAGTKLVKTDRYQRALHALEGRRA